MLQSFRVSQRFFNLLAAILSQIVAPPLLPAGILAGNIWPNPTLETDTNSDGVPDFWHKGGNLTAIDIWTTSISVSPTHAFQLNDTSTGAYGEWYSDLINVTAATNYLFRYNLRYIVTNIGPMRVTVNFYDAASSYIWLDFAHHRLGFGRPRDLLPGHCRPCRPGGILSGHPGMSGPFPGEI